METSAFLKAVNAGKTKLKTLREKQNVARPTTFKVPSEDGVQELEVDLFIKPMSCSDFEEYGSMQWDHTQDPAVRICSPFVAAVIVGARDKDGAAIFDTTHIEFLDDALNVQGVIELAGEVLGGSELDSDSRAEKKPE